jgi:hypothetical protein
MASLLFSPVVQFIDANGMPYAGGTLNTYAAGTSSPKQTWSEHTGTALNTNPIQLDSAGRCQMFGDGEYRLVLRDAAGNQVWDQYSTTIVSAAMQPVVVAPTLVDARQAMGITDAVADTAEANARAAADTAETNARIDAVNLLTTNLNSEITRAQAAEANLQSQISGIVVAPPTFAYTTHTGSSTTDGSGAFTATWPAFSKMYIGLQIAQSDPLFVGGYFQPTTITLNSYNGTLNTTDNLYPTPTTSVQAGKTFNWTVQGY